MSDLLPVERQAVVEYVKTKGDVKAAAKNLNVPSTIFNRTHVRKTLAQILKSPSIQRQCIKVLKEGLSMTDDSKPIECQREKRQTVETICRITGDLIPNTVMANLNFNNINDDELMRSGKEILERCFGTQQKGIEDGRDKDVQ